MANRQVTVKVSGWVALAIYLGLGLLTHIIFVSTSVDWSSAFSLFVILLWWMYLVYLFIKWVVILGLFGLGLWLAYLAGSAIMQERNKHILKQLRKHYNSRD